MDREWPRWKRRKRRTDEELEAAAARRDARAIYALQMREAIMRFRRDGFSNAEIAQKLGQTEPTIARYAKLSIAASIRRSKLPPLPAPQQFRIFPMNTNPPKRKSRSPFDQVLSKALPSPVRSQSRPESSPGESKSSYSSGGAPRTAPNGSTSPPGFSPSSSESDAVSGELLESPEIIQLRRDCLHLRKAMRTHAEIAELLDISELEVRQRTFEALQELQTSEISNSDIERRLMLEQIDQMIAAIHPMSTGRLLNNERTPVVLEAIDRMLRLMKQKAELLGISAPPAVDIRIRLQALADEGGYDIVDLEDIAREVLQAHKVRLPEFRG